LVATHLQKQLSDRQKILTQYESSVKEYQSYKEKSEKQVAELMALLHKMAADLDASVAANRPKDPQPEAAGGGNPAAPVNPAAAAKQTQQHLQDLQWRLAELDKINANQAEELSAYSARMRRIDQAFSGPIGRIIARLYGVKK
jgi:chromosome segregation ATPase